MQSDKGERLLKAYQVDDPLSSMLVIDKNQLYKKVTLCYLSQHN